MSSTRRTATSTSFQQLFSVSRSPSTSVQRQSRLSPNRSTTRTRVRKSRSSTPNHSKFSSRVMDVTPLFSVEGAVRHVEVVSDHVAWTADTDGSIRARAVPKGTEMRVLEGRAGAFCTCLLFIEQTGKVWAAFSDGFIRVHDVASFALEGEFLQHDGAVECMVEMEGCVYTGGRDWKIYRWDKTTCQYERLFFGHSNTVRCFCPYSGATGGVLFSGSDDGTVRAWDPYAPVEMTKDEKTCMHTFVGHSLGVLALELVAPNNQLWSAGEDATIRVWDLQTLQCVKVLRGHSAPVSCLTLVDHRVWSGDKHGRMLLWSPKALAPVQDLSQLAQLGHTSVLAIRKIVPTVAWKVWSTGSAGHIQCWNAESVPIVLEADSLGEIAPLPREGEGEKGVTAKAHEDIGALRSEVTRLTKLLESERRRAKLELFHEKQSQQALRDDNTPLRQKLRDRRPPDGGAATDEGDLTSRVGSDPARPRSCELTTMPGDNVGYGGSAGACDTPSLTAMTVLGESGCEGSVAVLRAVEARLADTEEEYAALQTFVDSRLKPLISRLKRTNGEKDLDLRW
ncbi:hypothetical protein DQ04_08131000 [Trypanosoma grayi]|uniref:hypothetical protein n=1 Tax=Trypanosoma grayi TaxID=71804 RepID=UPI0004F3FCC0|nr:hypothetical protein DQ04_08131000 [Trypanosoma grayi]KEG08049.1 hypothetical protein DQ04_08131000 [Trypanosoma grayi]